MTHVTHHPLDHLMQTANVWLAEVRDEFDTGDADFTYRVTRAWLHALRDRLPVAESAHFAAQLPDVLRGVYYDGWRPAEVSIRCHPEQFIRDAAASARVAPGDLPGSSPYTQHRIAETWLPVEPKGPSAARNAAMAMAADEPSGQAPT